MRPWMSQVEIDFLQSFLDPDDIVFEWGCGGSTLNFAPKVHYYYSVEHDKAWYDEIKENLPENVHLLYIPTNITTPGIPQRCQKERDYYIPNLITPAQIKEVQSKWEISEYGAMKYLIYKDYVNSIWTINNEYYNRIIVDGRARVMCAIQAIDFMDEESLLFIHDYTPRRDYYKSVENYLEEVKRVDTLSMFKLKI